MSCPCKSPEETIKRVDEGFIRRFGCNYCYSYWLECQREKHQWNPLKYIRQFFRWLDNPNRKYKIINRGRR